MIPSGVTRVIWAIAPNEGVREAMMGDFAEEFAVRSDRDGVAAARRWCWRQAITSLVDTLRHTFPSAAVIATNVSRAVLYAYVLSTLTALAIFAATLPLTTTLTLWMDQIVAVKLVLALMSVPVAVIAGYEVARVGSKAPLWSAVFLCVFIVALNLAAGIALPRIVAPPPVRIDLPLYGRAVMLALVLPSIIAGAVLQQAQHRRLMAEGKVAT